jgi:hypothetical protein
MMTLHPERTVAVWCRSGTAFIPWEKGEIAKPTLSPAVYEIPVMCNPGIKERDDQRFAGAWNGCLEMFRAYRKAGAPIGFAPDPRTGHECGDSRYLAIPWFAACLELRLPEKASSMKAGAEQKLRVIDQTQSWLAKEQGAAAQPAANYYSEAKAAVWLPNESVARTWEQYVKSGEPLDQSPPPAPEWIDVELLNDKGIRTNVLKWKCATDFESGLAGFVIYRGDKEIGRLPEKPIAKFGRPLYQPLSYHDTPEKNSPGLDPQGASHFEFKTEGSPSGGYEYRIQAINSDGMTAESRAWLIEK